MKNKVSVIVTTCNRLEFLKKTVGSVLAQTFKDFEVIISDDASNDDTEKWCKMLEKNHKNVTYYRHKRFGMIGNWNAGVKQAKGKYISLLMDDDLWGKDFLKETVKVLDKYPNVGFVDTWIVPFRVDDSNKKNYFHNEFYRLRDQSCIIDGHTCIKQYLSKNWLVGLPSAILCRKRCFQELGYFHELGLDPEMWLRICSKYDMYYLDKKLTFWRMSENNSFSSTDTNDLLKHKRKLFVLNSIKNFDLKISEKQSILDLVAKAKRYNAYSLAKKSLLPGSNCFLSPEALKLLYVNLNS